MKIKVSISGKESLRDSIKKRLKDALDKTLLKEIGQEVVQDIQINARRGYGVKDGKQIKLDPLKDSTIKHRDYLDRAGNATARPFKDDFSNLSVSGQLIDSVKYEVKDGSIEIGASGTREPYKKLNGTLSEAKIPTNEQLSKIHHRGNPANNLPTRPFIGLRSEMMARIIIKIRERIRQELEVVFKIKK
jgi:phage gpG-like protein